MWLGELSSDKIFSKQNKKKTLLILQLHVHSCHNFVMNKYQWEIVSNTTLYIH